VIKASKQYAMRAVKFLVGLFPAKTRKKMRQNLGLFNVYSRSLQKSGLFYGFPSPHKLQKLYVKTIRKQSQIIAEICSATDVRSQMDCFVILDSRNKESVDAIKAVLLNEGIHSVYLIGENSRVERYKQTLASQSNKLVGGLLDYQHSATERPVILLREGDRLHSNAISVFDYYVSNMAKSALFYCDIDVIDQVQTRQLAEFFPAWDPDLQLTSGYVKTGVVVNDAALIRQWLDLLDDKVKPEVIALWLCRLYLSKISISVQRIPLCLVHQKRVTSYDWASVMKGLEHTDFIAAKGASNQVAKLQWHQNTKPLVTLIIPTKNAKALVETCITSILSKTDYQNYEILLVDNNSDDKESLAYFEHLQTHEPKVTVLVYPYPFNYSAINNFAASHANGDIIGLINNDIEVISTTWLGDMVGHVMRADIGCVGAKLLFPDTRIQHAGVVMGYGGGAGHAHKYFPRYHSGYLNRLVATNGFSAVTAACLLVTKSDYDLVNGLNEKDLTVAFNDVDFCLRVRALGRRNLYCAEAELFHHESISRGADDTSEKRQRFESELLYLQQTWADVIKDDPAYNPNLTLRFENFSISEH
jgi:GT2 family glycosyltransferase